MIFLPNFADPIKNTFQSPVNADPSAADKVKILESDQT